MRGQGIVVAGQDDDRSDVWTIRTSRGALMYLAFVCYSRAGTGGFETRPYTSSLRLAAGTMFGLHAVRSCIWLSCVTRAGLFHQLGVDLVELTRRRLHRVLV